MTIFTVVNRKILGDKPWEVQDGAPALFSTYDKAIDYVQRMIGNKAKCINQDFWEEWASPIVPNHILIVEERTVDMN